MSEQATDRSRSETSRSTLGTICHRSSALRFAAAVCSAPLEPATYAQASSDIARSARRSSSSHATGTIGFRPVAPSR